MTSDGVLGETGEPDKGHVPLVQDSGLGPSSNPCGLDEIARAVVPQTASLGQAAPGEKLGNTFFSKIIRSIFYLRFFLGNLITLHAVLITQRILQSSAVSTPSIESPT